MWGLSNAVTGGIYSSLTAEASLIPIPRDMRTCCEIKRSQKFPSLCQVWGVEGGVFMTFYIWKWNLIRDVLFPYYCSVAVCVISAFPKHNCMWGFYIPPVEGVERHGDR